MALTNGMLFRSLFENMINGYAHCKAIYDDKGYLVDWEYILVNKAYPIVTGITQDVVGKRVSEVLPNFRRTNPETFLHYETVAKGGYPQKFDEHITLLDRWLSVSVFSIEKDTFSVIFENINDRKAVEKSKDAIEKAYEETINGFVWALHLRDHSTEEHSQRVVKLMEQFARRIEIAEEEITNMKRGALLHDIGKLVMEDAILNKPKNLTMEEMDKIKTHPSLAYKLLKPIEFLSQTVIDIPHYHHEYWNGKGYPEGRKGFEIPIAARMFSIIDVFDALTSKRPYRDPYSISFAIQYIENEAGGLFDPTLVKEFVKMIEGK